MFSFGIRIGRKRLDGGEDQDNYYRHLMVTRLARKVAGHLSGNLQIGFLKPFFSYLFGSSPFHLFSFVFHLVYSVLCAPIRLSSTLSPPLFHSMPCFCQLL